MVAPSMAPPAIATALGLALKLRLPFPKQKPQPNMLHQLLQTDKSLLDRYIRDTYWNSWPAVTLAIGLMAGGAETTVPGIRSIVLMVALCTLAFAE